MKGLIPTIFFLKDTFSNCSRLGKVPRRHQLRGPFGQMLMEEMAKSDLTKKVGERCVCVYLSANHRMYVAVSIFICFLVFDSLF